MVISQDSLLPAKAKRGLEQDKQYSIKRPKTERMEMRRRERENHIKTETKM